MANGSSRVETFRTYGNTVLDAMAAEYAEGVIQFGQTFFRCQIATIRQEAVGLQQASRADELVRIPPEGWTAG